MTMLNNILAVSWHEFRVMCTRYSILLVLSGGIYVYGLLYDYMCAPNVVRDAAVAVVDKSRTPLSRSYIRLRDNTPQARVLTNNADLTAAKELMKYDAVSYTHLFYGRIRGCRNNQLTFQRGSQL